jgi:hypothetical protein
MRNRSVRAVEVTEIGSIKWLSGSNSGWEKRNVLGMILELRTGGGIPFAKKVSAVAQGFSDNVRSTKAVRKLGHAIDGSFTLNLDSDHDEIIFGEQSLLARLVSTFTVVGAAFFSEDSKNFR